MVDHLAIWTDTQQRVVELARSLDDASVRATVPACPDWTAKDLVAHMVGVDADAVSGDVDESFSDTWTDKHVKERADASLTDVLTEWDGIRQRSEGLFADAPDALRTGMVVDASVHEQDLRGAVGAPGAKDQPGNRVALDMFAEGFDSRVREQGLPTLWVDCGDWTRTFGEGDPAVRVAVEEFDFQRALSGRRSEAQVKAWTWSDPEAGEQYLPHLSGFGALHGSDIVE